MKSIFAQSSRFHMSMFQQVNFLMPSLSRRLLLPDGVAGTMLQFPVLIVIFVFFNDFLCMFSCSPTVITRDVGCECAFVLGGGSASL